MEKTVYFLGAGFSADAGGPIQNDIIKFILKENFDLIFNEEKDILKAKKSFINFIRKDLLIPKNLWPEISLEDVFTPIDRSLSNGKSFKNYDVKELVNLRESFHLLMGAAINYGLDYSKKSKQYIDQFASFIDSVAKQRLEDISKDQISIITTNWDLLVDNALNKLVKKFSENEQINNRKRLAVVDYCCYISSLEDDEFIKPGLLALGRGGYNIKYLKLHGSMNWLHCPNCQRMYIKYNEKTMLIHNKYYCKHCAKNFKINKTNAIKLTSNLLLPTFIKDLSNIQIQLVWQNAAIELSEATKVVFIGYSLPSADFEIRQLLSRSIPNHASIEIIIYPGSSGNKTQEQLSKDIQWYKSFFGKRIKDDSSFIVKTVPEYIKSLNL
ncbi:hypothetical protein HZQ84_10545 [Elizabethkingia anophelis]|uniref:hypothetical protein n=1 Tax=Elizabethkingia anophelis TaxID=1117645 RepID=UPI00099A7B95|nr:hypothetical protein [Elizabethkingia anophelis]MCT3720485.1 hypothetical protein [Elizabethkingia anophelis]MCT3723995.1 hypothetical protein [Elizabethkingia anophelis]MDC8026494.1 hypothetical protein [Elizabethkingia anophelis]MDV3491329.1 hypothetical protein [Elizabethkingia anophelis]MDV4130959.1 hypothetical protein [Elizabethkingia anophelis]